MTLDYLGGLSVLTMVLTSERWRQDCQRRRSDMRAEVRVMQLLAGAINQGIQAALTAGKGKNTASLPEPSEGRLPCPLTCDF